MIPRKLRLRGFMCYREEQTLDFSGMHMTSLTGGTIGAAGTVISWSYVAAGIAVAAVAVIAAIVAIINGYVAKIPV